MYGLAALKLGAEIHVLLPNNDGRTSRCKTKQTTRAAQYACFLFLFVTSESLAHEPREMYLGPGASVQAGGSIDRVQHALEGGRGQGGSGQTPSNTGSRSHPRGAEGGLCCFTYIFSATITIGVGLVQ